MVADRPDRDKNQIEADLGATRDRLVSAVESLIDQVHPQRIKQREIAGAKRFVNVEIENAKALVYNARGDLRTDRLAAVGGAAGGLVSLLLVLRAVVRRQRSRGSAPSRRTARAKSATSRRAKPATSGQTRPAPPATSGPTVPAESGPAAPATPATSGKAAPASSGKASSATPTTATVTVTASPRRRRKA